MGILSDCWLRLHLTRPGRFSAVTTPIDISSTMQDDFPLTITAILEHGTRVFGGSECVTWQGDAKQRRVTYREIGANARRLASALTKLGIGTGDRVATLCWNSQEHLEAYYGVPCMGGGVATPHPRA